MNQNEINETIAGLLPLTEGSLAIEDGKAVVHDAARLRATIHRLAEVSALESGPRQGLARYVIRLAALAMGIYPASIHELYMARGRGDIPPTFSVPAFNLRAMSFVAARAAFRVAVSMDAGAFIFEIARSEIGYTDQRPAEYSASILAAAIAEGYAGPVFIQGDHFQVSAKRYGADAKTELDAVRELTREAILAGFYNIDIDASTLVDINLPTVPQQQALNSRLTAEFTALIRSLEPEGVTVSVGGEIGEVGGHNSNEAELRAFMDGFLGEMKKRVPGKPGISKISIQTGTSHGGVVLPDGSIAKVDVDFDTLLRLSRISRSAYHIGGTVQHGASTLPENAFGKFVESEAIEVHLATNFQNILFDRLAEDLRGEMYAWLDKNNAGERKPGMTDEQFYYKTRKNVIGVFKKQTWGMSHDKATEIFNAWNEQFRKLFVFLGMRGTRKYVEQTIKPMMVAPNLKYYLGDVAGEGDVSDLAD